MDWILSWPTMAYGRSPFYKSPGCEAWKKEEVYATTIPARGNFVYEVTMNDDIDDAFGLTELTREMEKKMARLVGRTGADQVQSITLWTTRRHRPTQTATSFRAS